MKNNSKLEYKKIGCVADFNSELAMSAYEELTKRYELLDAESLPLDHCDLIIVLGGDGMMLKTMHKYMHQKAHLYGMNRGSVGFLLNSYKVEDLYERITEAVKAKLYPLEMEAITVAGEEYNELAVNEVSLLRETNQAARIRIYIDGSIRMDYLVGDGILVATPAGSSAYNFAAHGPIIPIDANILALTPICPFRPRRWRGALIPSKTKIKFEILDPLKRPVSAVADFHEVRDVKQVTICQRPDIEMILLFDQEDVFEERFIKEQFMH
jgi:NAD+ kinase